MTQIIHMHDYDSDHIPSMPVVDIGLSTPQVSNPIYSTAIVDSGADSTMIPIQVIKQLKPRYIGKTYLRGVTGKRRPVSIYSVRVHIGENHVYKAQAVADPQNTEIIIGRDVLNHLEVTLNGFAGVTEIRA